MPDGSDDEYLAYVHGRTAELRRTAYLLCGDTHQADDFVQETLTKLYARWPRIGRVENVDAYVHTMLVRVFLDDRRRGWWKVRLTTGHTDRAAATGDPSDRPVVRAALARLPARQQAVLVLRYLCDKPVREVAELLRCSEGTVKSQTSHGLTRLRDILGPDHREPAVAASWERS
ncbi:SigE family RNA polymerase sigma factor [Actinoplanes couchii]|uniref:RNA polymerase sigma24 factor n=1 Tax=Actinoplanes couchii TaxID=403638 RepID=A0ABQ3X411_9ACTN|nr:SigE family RNA polymerase sigma factor [Actinoplanes couchii]MDR6322905.1 RNA polymerase sigma-70 factor (sigma-E family) [Actinoplanes couchii]GID53145.1 RNA polymerase sigma24 factor [Actinoplanes couchii]